MPEFEPKNKADKSDILFEAIRKILEKNSKEFRSENVRIIDHGNWTEKIIEPDSRKEYCQVVEFLSDFLLPHFDITTKEVYDQINKDLESALADYESGKLEHDKYIIRKTKIMRRLFQQLNMLLIKTDYLRRKAVAG